MMLNEGSEQRRHCETMSGRMMPDMSAALLGRRGACRNSGAAASVDAVGAAAGVAGADAAALAATALAAAGAPAVAAGLAAAGAAAVAKAAGRSPREVPDGWLARR